jgi:hypothetical protein
MANNDPCVPLRHVVSALIVVGLVKSYRLADGGSRLRPSCVR